MNFRTFLEHTAIYLKKPRVGQTVIGVLLFRERATKIQKQSVDGMFPEHMIKVLRLPHAEAQIWKLQRHFRLCARDKDVRRFLNRDKVYIEITLGEFHRESAFSAAYLQIERIGVVEHFFGAYEVPPRADRLRVRSGIAYTA